MKNLLGALLNAQQEFPVLVKDATNPAYRSRYATLSAVQEAAFPALHKHGLVVLQSARTEVTEVGLLVYVGATLFHVESGESLVQELGLSPTRTDPQGIGSAITYGRRYVLMTLLGLAADDDDGNGASLVGARVASTLQPTAAPPAGGPRGSLKYGQRPHTRAVAENGREPTLRESGESMAARPDWSNTNEAVAWSLSLGAFANEAEARAELKHILQVIYPGRESCKPHELPAVFDEWHAAVQARLDPTA